MHDARSLRALLLLVLSATAGCSAWRTPEKPHFDAPPAFLETPESLADAIASPAEGEWWHVFRDPLLDALIQQALDGNPNLAAVEARVAQARASLDTARAELWPSVGLTGGTTRVRSSQASAQPYEVQGGGTVPGGLELQPRDYLTQTEVTLGASYEADVFGRLRKNRNASHAEMVASEADLRAARLSLTSQIAASWYELVSTASQAESAGHAALLAQQAFDLQDARVQSGLVPANSLATPAQSAADARALAAKLEAIEARQLHALAALCGSPSEGFTIDLSRPMLPDAPVVAPNLPATVLQRRPDIASAEARLDAASQRVGAAKAAFLPQFVLTGEYGSQSEILSDLLSSDSLTWSFMRQITAPIFDGGRNRAALVRAQGAFDEASAEYLTQILTALREVNDALSDGRQLAIQIEAATQSLAAARWELLEVSDRLAVGLSSRSEVLAKHQSVLARERSLTGLENEQILATLALIQALGGSWSSEEDASPSRASLPERCEGGLIRACF